MFIESFAGTQAATQAVRSRFTNHATAAFDIQYSETMDINSSSGMGHFGKNKAGVLFAMFVSDKSLWVPAQGSAYCHLTRGPVRVCTLDGGSVLNMGFHIAWQHGTKRSGS